MYFAGVPAQAQVMVPVSVLAVGVMVTYVFLMAFVSGISFGFYLSVALLITGLVCTARLINSDHGPFEVYAGLMMGILAQLFAWWVTV